MDPFDPLNPAEPQHPHTSIAAAYALNPFDVVWRRHTGDIARNWRPASPPIWHAGNDYAAVGREFISSGIPWDFSEKSVGT